jgi:hypothetical protein
VTGVTVALLVAIQWLTSRKGTEPPASPES